MTGLLDRVLSLKDFLMMSSNCLSVVQPTLAFAFLKVDINSWELRKVCLSRHAPLFVHVGDSLVLVRVQSLDEFTKKEPIIKNIINLVTYTNKCRSVSNTKNSCLRQRLLCFYFTSNFYGFISDVNFLRSLI